MPKDAKQNILLLNPPGNKNYLRDGYCSSVAKGRYFWPPTDLIAISAVLGDDFFNIHILDCIAESLMHGDVLNYIEKNKIGILISQVASASKKTDLLLLKYVKESFPDIKIVLNGEYALKIPEQVLNKYDFVDAVIHDYTSEDIKAYLLNGDNIYGAVSYRRGSENILHTGKPEREIAFSGTPRHDLLKMDIYNLPWAKRLPVTATVTSFGCPFSCSFCVAGTYNYKERSVSDVIKELKLITQLGIKEVYFLDSLFTANKKRTIELCEKIVSEGMDISWSCLSRVNTYDEDVLSAMKRARCHTIQLGIESGSDEVLKKIKKGFKVKDVEKAVYLANKFKINVDGFFILGFPDETKEQINATINLAERLDFNFVSFQLAMPLKGTELESTIVGIDDISFDDAENAVSINKNFTIAELKKIQRRANLAYYFRLKFILRQVAKVESFTDFKSKFYQAMGLIIPKKNNARRISKHEAFKRLLNRYKEKSPKVYWYIRLKKSFYDSWLWNILYLLPPKGKIYDLGCGFGLLGNLCYEINGDRVSLEGVDLDEKRIKNAKAIIRNTSCVKFKVQNILDIDFSDGHAATLTDFLHHIPFELQNKIIKRIYDTLPQGGSLLIKEISSKNVSKFKYYFALLLEKVLYPFGSIYYRREEEIYNFLKNTGFDKIEIINMSPHNIILCEKGK